MAVVVVIVAVAVAIVAAAATRLFAQQRNGRSQKLRLFLFFTMNDILIRQARPEDATGMGRVMVDTYLAAHHGQMPEEAWIKRRDEWTYEVSERGWRRSITELATQPEPNEFFYVAEYLPKSEIVGLAHGHRSKHDLLPNAGEVGSLYVGQDFQGRGIGRDLVRAVAAQLAAQGCGALIICAVTASSPARGFYEAIGGRVIGEADFDEEGWSIPQTVYGWDNIWAVPQTT